MKNSGYRQKKLIVFGLDCADPRLMFDKLSEHIPACRKLSENGFAASMRSTDPPLTIPAWSSMTTGKDPGQLGLYGIRSRVDFGYDSLRLSHSLDVKTPRIWDVLGSHQLRSILVGIPQTYPITPVNGVCLAGIPAPESGTIHSWPAHIGPEIKKRFPDYRVDIDNFRTISTENLLHQLISMTRARFAAFRHLLETQDWDFAMMVEIGLDRLHHAFWHHWDAAHPLFIEDSVFENAIPDYYALLDQEINDTLDLLPSDCGVLIVSDHGAQPMQGGIRINHWLIKNGWMTLKQTPWEETPLSSEMVNWSATRAWGEGGYFGRVFLNVEGREPNGAIPRNEFHNQRQRLAAALNAMRDIEGNLLGNQVLYPEKLYKEINGIPPDLMVYFGSLAWRSLGGVGPNPDAFGDGVFTRRNDRGPDGANHDFFGVCIGNFETAINKTSGTFRHPGKCDITDIMSIVLHYFNITETEPMVILK
ncbi:MAG: alkaline phosphatase family protein [bacterium]